MSTSSCICVRMSAIATVVSADQAMGFCGEALASLATTVEWMWQVGVFVDVGYETLNEVDCGRTRAYR
jgi:hypothetical protein